MLQIDMITSEPKRMATKKVSTEPEPSLRLRLNQAPISTRIHAQSRRLSTLTGSCTSFIRNTMMESEALKKIHCKLICISKQWNECC